MPPAHTWTVYLSGEIHTDLVVIHPSELTHPLKEVDAAANAVAETPEQVVQILEYVIAGRLG